MLRVLHQGQGLPLRLEAGQDVARVHPPLDQLERHLAADRPELLGEVDRPHAPLADLLTDLVAIGDDRIDEVRAVVACVGRACSALSVVSPGGGERDGSCRRRADPWLRDRRRAAVPEPGGLIVGGQQGVEPVAQRGVVTDLGVEERSAGRPGRSARWPPGTVL